MNCDWVQGNVTLYVYDELADDSRYELEQHIERCKDCAAEVTAAREFKMAMSALPQPEPSPNLLVASRMRLQEALEDAEPARGWRRFVIDPGVWLRKMKFSPALAAALLIVGFFGGVGTTYRIAMNRGERPMLPGMRLPLRSRPRQKQASSESATSSTNPARTGSGSSTTRLFRSTCRRRWAIRACNSCCFSPRVTIRTRASEWIRWTC